jgi:hypothetical protein
VNARAAVANTLWLAASWRAARRFARSLHDPGAAQAAWLRATLVRHADSEFGRRHDMPSLGTASEFARRVPLSTWADVEPVVYRIASGARDVLATGPVTHLAPTSGSTRARKLVPFTAGLQAGFNAAVSAWLHDLVRQRPRLPWGPAWWSISPLADEGGTSPTAVPIGHADDTEYLGASRGWLVRHALAVPAGVQHVRDVEAFRRLTLLALLRARDLRMISIWHPSFLDLLLEAAEPAWPELVDAVRGGHCPWRDALPPATRPAWQARPDAARAAELRRLGPRDWSSWWPDLQVVSCWGEQAAEPGWQSLVRRLPGVLVQPKGLLATECAVTIPWHGTHPLAVTSHYFEFLDVRGDVRGAHELELGGEYEVVVTNGGGLWRYRLGDQVACTGFVARTPALRFLGRAGRVSDLRGEKLGEPFVAAVLRDLWPVGASRPWAALRPSSGTPPAYEIVVAVDHLPGGGELALQADAALAANPHYALARRLGQLGPVRAVAIGRRADVEALQARRGRLGDAKPGILLDAAPERQDA